jgi:hypothetical protein
MTLQEAVLDPALKAIGILAAGRTAAPQEYLDMIDALNDLLDTCAMEGTAILQLTRDALTLTGPASYTIGAGATFNTVKPERIRAAVVLTANNTSQPVEIVSDTKWATIEDRSVVGTFADMLLCDYVYPVATIYLNPAPTGGTLELWSIKPLPYFVAPTDAVSLNPGYVAFLKFNLAILIQGNFKGSTLPDWLLQEAGATKAGLMKLHMDTLGEPGPLGTPMPVQPARSVEALNQAVPPAPVLTPQG